MGARRRTGNVLVLYGQTQFPQRGTISDHLYSFRRYSAGRVFYLNLAARETPRWLPRVPFDLIIWHTSFLSLRWAPEMFAAARRKAQPLKAIRAPSVALPQDEFIHTDTLCDFLEEFDVGTVCSVAPESEWSKIYRSLDRDRVRFLRVLTGYLDEKTVKRIDRIVAAMPPDRPIDVGYRAWHNAPWLGRHGRLKTRVAEVFQDAAEEHGLRVDISTRDEDTILGDDWYRFLASCKYTVGAEGGASVLDRDGSIRERTEAYLRSHPDADFDEVSTACFAEEDGRDGFLLSSLSPRQLEACATRTCQVLVEGTYSGILEPGRHYVEVRDDFSNLDEVLGVISADERRTEIVDRAYRDVVAGGSWTYRRLVDDVERAALGAPLRAPARPWWGLARGVQNLADRRMQARLALQLRGGVGSYVPAPVRSALRPFVRPILERLARWRARRLAAPRAGLQRVVSLTPMAVERDSRTFKQASSMSRLGYDSVVVEFLRSRRRESLGFELRTVESSLPTVETPSPEPAAGVQDQPELVADEPSGGVAETRRALRRLRSYVAEFLILFGRDTARATPDADLYYVHGYLQYPAVHLRRRRRRVPFIYDAHDVYSLIAPRGTIADRMESWFRERVEAICVRRAAEVVTVSPGCADLIEARYRRRPVVVRNCADLRLDEPAETDIRTAAGLGDDAFLLVLPGNAKPGIAFEEALTALSLLPEAVHLAFVGAGYGAHEEEARGSGLASRVHFIPPVSPTRVTSLIRSADLTALLYRGLTPSYVHMLPNGFFHAVAAGLPMIYPDLPDVRRLAEEYDLGLPIDASDPDSVAGQVRALLDDPKRLSRHRANAERARETLNWEHEERVLAQLIDRVLDNR
jgi:glycosyltransferase involved in cell wall biosynthesis